MTENNTDQEFINDVKAVFDRSVEQLDAGIESRLDRIRHKALAQKTGKSRRWIYYPAGALITACLVIIILSLSRPEIPGPSIKADDFEIFSTADKFDLYNNLEFYQWLEDYETSG